ARHVERPLQVDVDDGAEAVGGEVLRQADEIAGGAVYEDVETPEFGDRRVDGGGDGGRIANVGGFRRRAAPGRPQFRERRLEMLHLPAGDRDVAAVRGEGERDAAADAGPAAGHERRAASQKVGVEHDIKLSAFSYQLSARF